jgi:hypothetical protein
MERTGSAALALLTSALILSSNPAGASPGAPVIAHEPLMSFPKGRPVTLKAKIQSPIGKPIFSPAVFLRLPGVEGPARIPLLPVPGESNSYSAQIPSSLTQADFEYFIEAFDEEGNGPSRLASPESPIRAKAMAAAPSAGPPPTTGDGREPAPAPATALASIAAGRPWQRTAGMAAAAVGSGLLVGALAYGVDALLARGDVVRAANGGQFDAAMDRAKRSARAADVLAAAGAVAGCAGAALLLFGPKQGEAERAAIGVGAGPGAAGLLVQGRF